MTAAHVGYPLRTAGQGRTALVIDEDYLRGLVESVLFTRQGERVNRPEFGSGVDRLVFAPAGDELAEATTALVQAALQRWLGELLRVEQVAVEVDDAVLHVTIVYTPLVAGAPVPGRRSITVIGGQVGP